MENCREYAAHQGLRRGPEIGLFPDFERPFIIGEPENARQNKGIDRKVGEGRTYDGRYLPGVDRQQDRMFEANVGRGHGQSNQCQVEYQVLPLRPLLEFVVSLAKYADGADYNA